jgi:hypothetical protein
MSQGQSSPPPPVNNPSSNPASAANSSSGASSWFSKAKSLASTAAAVTSQAVQQGVEQSKKAYAEMKAAPTSIPCASCKANIEVPNNVFDWSCDNKHINNKDASICSTCQLAKPKQTDRTIICGACNASNAVPATNAQKALQNSVESTKKMLANVAETTKQQVNYLRSAPETFHCAHCNSLLAVPTGPCNSNQLL